MNESTTKAFQHHSHVSVSIFHYHSSSFLIFLFSSLILCFLCFLLFLMLLHQRILFCFSRDSVCLFACIINLILPLIIKLIDFWNANPEVWMPSDFREEDILSGFEYLSLYSSIYNFPFQREEEEERKLSS